MNTGRNSRVEVIGADGSAFVGTVAFISTVAREAASAHWLTQREPAMLEAEWLACDDPRRMLEWVRRGNVAADDDYPPNYPHCPERVSDRKLRLFCVAWRRAAGYPIDAAVEEENPPDVVALHGSMAGWVLSLSGLSAVRPATQAALLREIIENPFRPVMLPWRCRECGIPTGPPALGYYCVQCGSDGTRRHVPWRTPLVLSLATACYDDVGGPCGRCSGTGVRVKQDRLGVELKPCPDCQATGKSGSGVLDPCRLMVLADALEEAGCQDEDLLRHLRGEEPVLKEIGGPRGQTVTEPHYRLAGWRTLRGPHVKGCWVLDCILGKS